VFNGGERLYQRFFRNVLLEIGHGAEGQPATAVLVSRNDMYRDVARGRVVLQAVENRPSGHIGQVDIEGDRPGLKFTGQRERDAAPQGDQCLEVMLVRKVEEDPGERKVVLDDQEDLIRGSNQVAIVVNGEVLNDGGRRR